MEITKCIMTQSRCYKESGYMYPVGVLWHSTGANNPYLKRYVQPDDSAKDRQQLLDIIGENKNKNDWNHSKGRVGVNAFVGKDAGGSVRAVQVLPWTKRPWGCGRGLKGSCNSGWVQFEICEDGLKDAAYASLVFATGCLLTAEICRLYKIDPMGYQTVKGKKVPNITCHQEAARLGMASNHADILHWLPKYGYDMNKIRQEVKGIMTMATNKNITPAYSWAQESWVKACNKGIFDGTNPHNALTREQLAVILDRLGVI